MATRHAFRMRLKPGAEAEYKRRHDEIWPELARAHQEAGISDYTIFLAPETRWLFAVQRRAPDHRVDRLGDLEIVRQWSAYMSDLMETSADGGTEVSPLVEVFHLD